MTEGTRFRAQPGSMHIFLPLPAQLLLPVAAMAPTPHFRSLPKADGCHSVSFRGVAALVALPQSPPPPDAA
jgi:hypothetical protein